MWKLINNLTGRGGNENSGLAIFECLNKDIDAKEVSSKFSKVFTDDVSKIKLSCTREFQVSEEVEQQNCLYIPEATLYELKNDLYWK